MVNRNTGKTELFAQWAQGSLTIADQGQSTGARFWVDSVTGTDGAGYGKNPDSPFATIDYAVGRCTANKHDVIYVMPKHAESIAAGGIDLDVQGISVIGLGHGDDRPRITFTATDSDVDVDDCDILVKNLVFVSGIDAVVAMIDVNGDDFELIDCEFPEVTAMQVVSFIDLDGGGANVCDNFHMEGCRIVQLAAGADQAVDIAQVHDGIKIIHNVIDGDFVNAGLYSPAIFTNAHIEGNKVRNAQTGDHAIEFSAAGTGFLVNNFLVGDTLGTILDPGSMMCLGNLESDAIDQAGVTTPRTAAGGLPADAIDATSIADDAIDGAAYANDVGMWRVAPGNWNFTDDAGAQGAFTAYTVTGDVMLQVFAICDVPLTSGGAATVEVGVAGGTAVLIAQTTATDIGVANEIWHDASPTTTIEILDVMGTFTAIVPGGQDVIMTIATADLTAGDLDFYCLWTPLSADGNVVAA